MNLENIMLSEESQLQQDYILHDQVWFLGREDPLEEEISNPLQYAYLENSMDRGAWQATIHGVTKSWTQLKQLSTQVKCQE